MVANGPMCHEGRSVRHAFFDSSVEVGASIDLAPFSVIEALSNDGGGFNQGFDAFEDPAGGGGAAPATVNHPTAARPTLRVGSW